MKYTLYCEPGIYFELGEHRLMLGEWLVPDITRIILIHGTMTTSKAREIISNRKIAIFHDNRYHILSIEGYSAGYKLRHEETDLDRFVGWLYQDRENKNLFKGGLKL